MNKNKAMEIAKERFEQYPDLESVHITEDGSSFRHPSFASSHARTLGKEDFISIHRSELEGAEEKAEDGETGDPGAELKPEAGPEPDPSAALMYGKKAAKKAE